MGSFSTRGAILITGASTGIGQASALELARTGFRVFAGVRREADRETLAKLHPEIEPIFLDITDAAARVNAIQALAESIKPDGLAGLVNNAGIVVAAPLELLPLDELRRQFEVNVVAHLGVTQLALPLLRKSQGRIVNIGSISGKLTTPLLGAYSASKFALEALTDALRLELSRWRIHVSIIEPGHIATPLWEKSQKSARDLLERFSKEAEDPYRGLIEAVRSAAETAASSALPAQSVARVVTRIFLAKRPKTRYVVGADARVQALLTKLIPDRWLDWLILTKLQS